MNPHINTLIEDEYEYEYDENETETFFVDLDLTSVNQTTRSRVPGAPKPVIPSKGAADDYLPQSPDAPEATPNTAEYPDEGTNEPTTTQDTPSGEAGEDGPGMSPFRETVQILDPHSTNPIVSYKGQVYSCMWTDMIGTNMFFTQPGSVAHIGTLKSTDDYDLVGTSRIKLVAEGAKVVKNNVPGEGLQEKGDGARRQRAGSDDVVDGSSLGDFHRSNPKVNVQMKKQASFLEKLMNVKRQRGERDLVRTYVDEQFVAREKPAMHETMHNEIDDLNRRVIRGDAGALTRLQEIYSRPNEQDQDGESQQKAQIPGDEPN
ncbi:hypothetical protein LTR99_006446 [Exophiala xenobiotica]|uniref:Transcription factor TFIIIC triple barrel domain-containing protein n=1 Tax=Vermiconidia calcicola TaxID=1690605 RepID=A0AAV9QAL1_9PEZI|nr:hypothetical protein LTR96_007292 [Exophiala xenobiotica]KAK5536935.1 hypothetical protein LTR23_007783 [Chaetothyriales sp. CCFEE 6169]KAK5537616.1 hypothetical protein LTR25_004868 [Vermiconidia calcicola]KAK5301479.1 hypothetical protein LTR99_006446 [Exophiala xenobiotica]KAK5334998.1 hypothetical protein LTR98_008718 [Exophiala xenobiotica]